VDSHSSQSPRWTRRQEWGRLGRPAAACAR
jgi:hypothetical protein